MSVLDLHAEIKCLDERINSLDEKLSTKIDSLDKALSARIDSLDDKFKSLGAEVTAETKKINEKIGITIQIRERLVALETKFAARESISNLKGILAKTI
ncbi:conserved hypothetical protein [Candidatus Brocadia pituitae]|nr:conserved hypothetical protein [Candidatus Brocadia pituitae]